MALVPVTHGNLTFQMSVPLSGNHCTFIIHVGGIEVTTGVGNIK